MVSQGVTFLSATEIAEAIRSKQVSPMELLQSYLERIDRLDSRLHAYITVCREEALATARQMAHAYEQATPWHSMRAPAAE